MIDLHCHILPGIDDGPAGMSESLAMARCAVKDGIHTIVATPHALGGSFDNPPEKIRDAVFRLQKRLENEQIPLTLLPGAEVHICPNLARRILAEETVFLSKNRRYVLVEFPFQTIPTGFREELFHLLIHGITPVIAHPERNPMACQDLEFLSGLMEMGCLVQINSTSVAGGFGDDVMICAHRLIEQRQAHIIASDAHSFHHRPPFLSLAVRIAQKILRDKEEALQMVYDTPKRIIAGL